MIEILSPSNRDETWSNAWAYTTIPSVQEIAVISAIAPEAELLRSLAYGSWPAEPLMIKDGDVTFASVGLTVPLEAIYRTTRFASG